MGKVSNITENVECQSHFASSFCRDSLWESRSSLLTFSAVVSEYEACHWNSLCSDHNGISDRRWWLLACLAGGAQRGGSGFSRARRYFYRHGPQLLHSNPRGQASTHNARHVGFGVHAHVHDAWAAHVDAPAILWAVLQFLTHMGMINPEARCHMSHISTETCTHTSMVQAPSFVFPG